MLKLNYLITNNNSNYHYMPKKQVLLKYTY